MLGKACKCSGKVRACWYQVGNAYLQLRMLIGVKSVGVVQGVVTRMGRSALWIAC